MVWVLPWDALWWSWVPQVRLPLSAGVSSLVELNESEISVASSRILVSGVLLARLHLVAGVLSLGEPSEIEISVASSRVLVLASWVLGPRLVASRQIIV
jgi:hypothetical protein